MPGGAAAAALGVSSAHPLPSSAAAPALPTPEPLQPHLVSPSPVPEATPAQPLLSAAAHPLPTPEPLQPLLVNPSPVPEAPPAQPLLSATTRPLPSPEPLQPLLVSLYLSCGLVGRIAELLSLMDSPMRGRLSRPVPEHVMQVWWRISVGCKGVGGS